MQIIQGGFKLRDEDQELVMSQRAITAAVNSSFIQVGAVFLKPSIKFPIDEDWAKRLKGDTNLQSWIDDPDSQMLNVGFNLQMGWMDVDIDAEDPEFNRAILAAMDYLKIDTRFKFGRKSTGVPTHVMLQLGEEEAASFEYIHRFEPREFRLKDKRYHVQLRSYPTNTDEKNLLRQAKQTVMPGSIYTHKKRANEYDVSIWYGPSGPAKTLNQIASTTPRKVNFNEVVRAIAFGTFAYLMQAHWVEGSRQSVAQRVTGWLARVVRDSQAMNNHEVISADVFCPIDTDDIAESLLYFTCDYLLDDEKHMRVRAYRDAVQKLARNPDARVPGWPAIEQLLGGEGTNALRTVFTPGSDVSVLTNMAERYVYDETDNSYVDRQRFKSFGNYVHEGAELERRHKGDMIKINGKPREAFKVFESSDMRKRVGFRDMFPDLPVGSINRINAMGKILSDDDEEDDTAMAVFNTWRGWPVGRPDVVDAALLNECEQMLDRVLMYLTRDNKAQVEWIKDWFAWTFQFPADKQQIAWVVVGGQGVGKSFIGNIFAKQLMGRLWSSASPNIIENNKFNIGPFKDAMFTFIDEAKFHGETGTDEIKKLIRNVEVSGMEKFEEARNYRIFSRLMFASNRFDVNVGQRDVRDRALFYTRAYDKDHLNMSEMDFREWTETLKPFFESFATMLSRIEAKQHFIEMFMRRKVDRKELESVRLSSSTDPTIVESNMSWSRRVAKYIVEEGRIHEDLSIDYPFTIPDFNNRVAEVSKLLSFKNMIPQRVWNEFVEMGLVAPYAEGGKRYYRFKVKQGDLVDQFGAMTSTKMDVRFDFTDEHRGENTTTLKDRKPWLGGRVGVVQSFKA